MPMIRQSASSTSIWIDLGATPIVTALGDEWSRRPDHPEQYEAQRESTGR
jgi:hypothetical protein